MLRRRPIATFFLGPQPQEGQRVHDTEIRMLSDEVPQRLDMTLPEDPAPPLRVVHAAVAGSSALQDPSPRFRRSASALALAFSLISAVRSASVFGGGAARCRSFHTPATGNAIRIAHAG